MNFNDREKIIALTPLWKGERFPDGRPKVADKYLDALYGMTLEEYATSTIASMDLTSMLSDLNASNVYYVEGDQIYNAGTWSSTMGSTTFTLEGDTLTLSGQLGSELNGDLVCKRAG